MRPRCPTALALVLAAVGCGTPPAPGPDACSLATCVDAARASDVQSDTRIDAGARDVATGDGATMDADGAVEAGAVDAGTDARGDGGAADGALDAGTVDAGVADVGVADAAHDAGTDAVRVDVATGGGCVSGATGTMAVRFQWTGSSPGSTATVRYEANELPDTSRWMVTANSREIGYRPVFDDTFLGAGGLDLEGTAFIDVALSTAGLGSIAGVTIAVFGRSFDTTTDGSFAWQTFADTGAAPTDLVSNVAPYRWYAADATSAFVPGDSGVLLRITPGPSSDALIVDRVEICFDAR